MTIQSDKDNYVTAEGFIMKIIFKLHGPLQGRIFHGQQAKEMIERTKYTLFDGCYQMDGEATKYLNSLKKGTRYDNQRN